MPNGERKLLTNLPLASPEEQAEKIKGLKRLYGTIMRKLASDIGPALDFPGSPLGPGLAAFGTLKATAKGAGKLLPKFMKLPPGKGTAAAFEYGAKYAKDPEALRALSEGRKKLLRKGEKIHAMPKTKKRAEAQLRLAIEGQFYREALEEAGRKVGKKLPPTTVGQSEFQRSIDELVEHVEGLQMSPVERYEKLRKSAFEPVQDIYEGWREAMIEGYKSVGVD